MVLLGQVLILDPLVDLLAGLLVDLMVDLLVVLLAVLLVGDQAIQVEKGHQVVSRILNYYSSEHR